MRPKVFVVEGKHDSNRLKEIYPGIVTVETNGSAVDSEQVNFLKSLDDTHDIVLFLDPDHAGERIRRILSRELSHIYHAFIDQKDGISKNHKKIGIEHASNEVIKKALEDMKVVIAKSTSDITHAFLFEMRLNGHKDSKLKRELVAQKLGLGHVNGKTLYHRLRMFNKTQKDVIEVLK